MRAMMLASVCAGALFTVPAMAQETEATAP